jgi:glycogen debranching enzyme
MANIAEEPDKVTQIRVLSLLQLEQTDSSTDVTPHGLLALDNPVTPKTPADEGKDYFLRERRADEQPTRVYELRLDPDGGPNKDRSVSAICIIFIPVELTICTVYSTSASIYPIHFARLSRRRHASCKERCIQD